MRWVIAYDVSPDPIRLAIARVLEEVGTRVQESVFEVAMEVAELAQLQQRLAKALERPVHGQGALLPRLPRLPPSLLRPRRPARARDEPGGGHWVSGAAAGRRACPTPCPAGTMTT